MIPLPFESGLEQLQRSFADAVFAADAPIPATIRAASGPAIASRFGVYRNNVICGLINAVRARYPVVRRLLWDDGFDRAAFQYVTAQPPRSPVLLEYGEGFPEFLRTIGQGAAVDYLADIAALEAARTRAYHAADAQPVGAAAFSALSPERLADMRVELHPSVVLLKSRFPVVSIWQANHYDNDDTITVWKPESALIARPNLQVEVRRLSPAGYEFIAALLEHQTVGQAVAHAAGVPGFDLAACLTMLIAADIVVGFDPAEDPPD
jgi:hypothetical protein